MSPPHPGIEASTFITSTQVLNSCKVFVRALVLLSYLLEHLCIPTVQEHDQALFLFLAAF